jgi:glycosyltransferase involved in cell wall biosynthesis
MHVVQTVLGVFHHFELARELERRHYLEKVYSTFPWTRLKREHLPRERVETFPFLHAPQMLLARFNVGKQRFHNELDLLNRISFDLWVKLRTAHQPAPDALITISSSTVAAAVELKRRGTVIICDRGSAHQAYQERIVVDEFTRWGLSPPIYDARLRDREAASYRIADAITVPSEAAKKSFLKLGVAASKVHVIPYGVRLDQFTKIADPPTDSFEVLFVGGVNLRKGIPYLLQAFAEVRHPKKRLTIIGSPGPEIAGVVAKLPTDDVRFLGSLPQSQLVQHMSRSHVLVLPSVEDGFGLVMPQAMACGCPILASTGTGATDLYTDGVEGFIVPIRNPEALQARLQQLADDPVLQAQMGAAALERVKSLGGWHHYGERWESLLKQVTGQR